MFYAPFPTGKKNQMPASPSGVCGVGGSFLTAFEEQSCPALLEAINGLKSWTFLKTNFLQTWYIELLKMDFESI